ncbi:SDR family NAD(P)-dependent oxidoreductase [Aeromicrobium sp. SMF47]|uniref:SDR family oxidoreductase n=1 Tax=Aeromicrobium TaxID=2040 RepID=UPI00129EBA68|nr:MULTISPECIES: SDR family oxidoreductase [Aeromicrobium]MRJ75499.1 SDR family NAD(P)-dependent oxidoreductase [Aeromicrobium yanjiei]MRK02478.1 SDR family NAD(P)-dependent oxidoreductase [Aeromicrobium sp. S22]
MANTFAGKVALITGAARGIGAGVARGYVEQGGRVALIGLEPERLAALADELGAAAAWWEADVRDGEQVKAAIDAAAQHFGRIDTVLANAGIASYGTVRQIDDSAFERVVDINVNGVFRTLKYATPHLERSQGYALVVASLASFTALAGLASYNASKAGAESLALAYKQEVAHLGIGVGICHPSWIDTDIVRNAEKDLPAFREVRRKLPYPANSTTSVEECVELILVGLARRKSRVYVPKGVLLASWTKALTNSPLAWPVLKRIARRTVPDLEHQVDALGRFHHAHVPETDAAEQTDQKS